MRVLVACEMSGTVRDAFARRGHDAWSCDLLPNPKGHHYQTDVLKVITLGWDLLIAHPPCTYLTNSAAWAYKDADFARYPGVGYHQQVKPDTLTGAARRAARADAVAFVLALAHSGIPRIAIENPIGHLSNVLALPHQTVQPHWFGDDASKATVLWLHNLPPLTPTRYIEPRIVNGKPRWANQTDNGQNKLSPSDDRAMLRSLTYPGLAAAMADQWNF